MATPSNTGDDNLAVPEPRYSPLQKVLRQCSHFSVVYPHVRRMALGRVQSIPMQHTKVIERFVKEGQGGRGTLVKANEDLLYTQVPQVYRPYGSYYGGGHVAGRQTPLAVRLEDGSVLANGAGMQSPMRQHQWELLKTLERSQDPFRSRSFSFDRCRLDPGQGQ